MMIIGANKNREDSRVTYKRDKDGYMDWGIKDIPWESLEEGKVITEEVSRNIFVAMAKLMDYEETGLLPDEIETLKEMVVRAYGSNETEVLYGKKNK